MSRLDDEVRLADVLGEEALREAVTIPAAALVRHGEVRVRRWIG